MNKLNTKIEGMPKIAEGMRNNRGAILLVLLSLLMVVGYYFVKTRSDKEVETHVEESYSINADSTPDQTHVPAPTSAPVNVVRNEEPINKDLIAAQMALVQAKQQELQQRLSAPLMIVNSGIKDSATQSAQTERYIDPNPNTQFLQGVSQRGVQTVSAMAIGSLSSIVAAGNFIHAILEPATNSDLPGSLRAIVSESVYAEDGSNVLIPRGSRLTGEYKSGMIQGQSRIFIAWQRLLTPEGVSIELGSGGVDVLGVSGVGADSIDRHFWERFGTASLLSMIGAGAANVGVSGNDTENSASSYRAAIANSFSQSANQSLQQEGMIAPTLRTMQGKPIMVFVARDLQFDAAIKNTKPQINIF